MLRKILWPVMLILSFLHTYTLAFGEESKKTTPVDDSASINNRRENWSDYDSDGGMGDGNFDEIDEDEDIIGATPQQTPTPKN